MEKIFKSEFSVVCFNKKFYVKIIKKFHAKIKEKLHNPNKPSLNRKVFKEKVLSGKCTK